jgi:hypothetical protein
MISTLYSAGQIFHDSVYQGSMYVEVSYKDILKFDSAYTMMEPLGNAIEPPTVAVTNFSSNLFMGTADGLWVYKLYNGGVLVKTVQMVDQQFAIPIMYDRIESISMGALQMTSSSGTTSTPVPSPGMGLMLGMAALISLKRRRFT